MAEIVTQQVTVTGPGDQVAVFLRVCRAVEVLCSVGASRTLVLPVDGDGAGALRFEFAGVSRDEVPRPEITGAHEIRVGGIGG